MKLCPSSDDSVVTRKRWIVGGGRPLLTAISEGGGIGGPEDVGDQ